MSPPTSLARLRICLSRFLRRSYAFFSLRSTLRRSFSLSVWRTLESVSLPLDRPILPSLFFALFVSFSSPPRCPSLSLLIASMYLLYVYLSFFSPSLTHSFSFFRCFRPTRAYKPRNSVEYARRCAFDTRHLVQCVGGEREEISRRSSFLRECLFSLSHAREYTRSLSLRTTISVLM